MSFVCYRIVTPIAMGGVAGQLPFIEIVRVSFVQGAVSEGFVTAHWNPVCLASNATAPGFPALLRTEHGRRRRSRLCGRQLLPSGRLRGLRLHLQHLDGTQAGALAPTDRVGLHSQG